MFLSSLLDWVYPPVCIACGMIIPVSSIDDRKIGICPHCQTLFEPIDQSKVCLTCGTPTTQKVERCASCYGKIFNFAQNHATFCYDGIVRDLLLELKFTQKKQIAQSLGEIWAKYLPSIPKDTVLVPLPLHKQKQKQRGFNQAKILAKAISKPTNAPIENVLLRIVDTPPQSGMHPSLRIENVANAFAIAPNTIVAGKSYTIIDDIFTTGASLNECARVLADAGAKHIHCVTFSVVEKKKTDDDLEHL